MGLLSLGTPLKWSEAKQYADHVRSHGIDQFLAIYNKMKDKQKDCLLWGDEVIFWMVAFDGEGNKFWQYWFYVLGRIYCYLIRWWAQKCQNFLACIWNARHIASGRARMAEGSRESVSWHLFVFMQEDGIMVLWLNGVIIVQHLQHPGVRSMDDSCWRVHLDLHMVVLWRIFCLSSPTWSFAESLRSKPWSQMRYRLQLSVTLDLVVKANS